MEEKLEIKTTIKGEAEGEVKEMRILNRVVKWTRNGITYEADPRHAEIIIRELGLQAIVGADTAGSARIVAQGNDPTAAALAPEMAAEAYGLEILRRDVEDAAHNTTRFLILSREPLRAANNGPTVITTFVFRVRNVPAALYKALGGFATNGVNMTKLESYQLEGQFFASMFYADVEGHPDDRSVSLALEELEFFCAELKLLGVYRADPFRDKIREPEANRALRPTPGI